MSVGTVSTLGTGNTLNTIDTSGADEAQGTQGSQGSQGAQGTQGSKDDMDGVIVSQGGTGTTPQLNLPKGLNATAMMIALTALNGKIASEGVKLAETSMEGARKDIKLNAAKRAEQLEKYLENMDNANQGKTAGLFGTIGLFFKALFTDSYSLSDWAETAKNSIGKIFSDLAALAGAVAMVVLGALATGVTFGAGTPVLVGACIGASLIVAGLVVGDPAVVDAIVEACPDDNKMAATIGLMITGIVLSIAGSILGAVATGGSSVANAVGSTMRAVGMLVDIGSAVINAGVAIDSTVKGHQRAEFQTEATISQAEMDKHDAIFTQLQSILDRSNADIKMFFDALSNYMQSTRDLLATAAESQQRAASV